MIEQIKSLDVSQVMELLPHRYPFLLIDKVIELKQDAGNANRVGQTCVAVKNVTINEPFFQGHFPHRPIMPGVLILEAMAQAAALACYQPNFPRMDVSIASIKESRFHRPVVPGDVLTMYGEVIKDRGKMLLLGCKAMVGDELVTSTQILAHVVPIDK